MKTPFSFPFPSSLAFFFCLLFSLNGKSSGGEFSYSAPTFPVGNESLGLEFGTSYFITDGHYDFDGKEEAMESGESFQKLDLDILGKYGLHRKFEVRLGGRFRQNKSEGFDSNGQPISPSKTGIESFLAGGKYLFPQIWKFFLSGDVYIRRTFFSNDPYDPNQSDDLILGDEGTEIGVGAHGTLFLFNNGQLNPSLIYRSSSEELSREFLYDIQGAYKAGNTGLTLLGGLEGIYSLKSDGYTKDPENKPPLNTGSTRLFNSVNRSYMAPYVGVHYTLNEQIGMQFHFKKQMNGVSTDKGREFALSFLWRSKGVSDKELTVQKFKDYEIEATVVKISPREGFIKIDKGMADDVEKGMKIDVFQFDYLGGNVLVASGHVYEVGANSAIVKINKRYRNMRIKVGFMARGGN